MKKVKKVPDEISVDEVRVKLQPLIDIVVAESNKNVATISFGALMRAGKLLQRQLDEWNGRKGKYPRKQPLNE